MGGLFVLPKMHKITQNSLLKKHGIFCLTFSFATKIIFFLTYCTVCGTLVDTCEKGLFVVRIFTV